MKILLISDENNYIHSFLVDLQTVGNVDYHHPTNMALPNFEKYHLIVSFVEFCKLHQIISQTVDAKKMPFIAIIQTSSKEPQLEYYSDIVSDWIIEEDQQRILIELQTILFYYHRFFFFQQNQWLGNFCLPSQIKLNSKLKKLFLVATKNSEPVLLVGETGTGKDLLAKEIHYHSTHKEGPYLPFNCASVPTSLLSGELFGSAKGAFTGATGKAEGKLAAVKAGTLFLDELGELPKADQVLLLRALENREYMSLGDNEIKSFQARVIAAVSQNKDLLVGKTLRTDLYYRLALLVFEIPPLRKRLEDLPTLVANFTKQMKTSKFFNKKAFVKMENYHWPGNIRQLRNVVKKCILLTDGSIISDEDIEFT